MTQAKRHRSQRHGNDEHAESERSGEAAGAAYRRKLVDEVCSVCGYARKYAIKVLNGNRPGPRGQSADALMRGILRRLIPDPGR